MFIALSTYFLNFFFNPYDTNNNYIFKTDFLKYFGLVLFIVLFLAFMVYESVYQFKQYLKASKNNNSNFNVVKNNVLFLLNLINTCVPLLIVRLTQFALKVEKVDNLSFFESLVMIKTFGFFACFLVTTIIAYFCFKLIKAIIRYDFLKKF
ncbi:hypothetical protein [Spiroplasma tabanidicola]|uniref:Uncharacterized protein n=1 Tax=Spiroplasma tabanidicola TaxID=324079 RepID=A0A6I6CAW8_9MOLU|nr:hypothetical protein [Spiroplasma tabanidicola]QGS52075.1 hypothetical protein STABA_v1c07190 [Spiroplasma tabanidicola]